MTEQHAEASKGKGVTSTYSSCQAVLGRCIMLRQRVQKGMHVSVKGVTAGVLRRP